MVVVVGLLMMMMMIIYVTSTSKGFSDNGCLVLSTMHVAGLLVLSTIHTMVRLFTEQTEP